MATQTHFEPTDLFVVTGGTDIDGAPGYNPFPWEKVRTQSRERNSALLPTLPIEMERNPLARISIPLYSSNSKQIFQPRSRAGVATSCPLELGSQEPHRREFGPLDEFPVVEFLGSSVFLVTHQTLENLLAFLQSLQVLLQARSGSTPCDRACVPWVLPYAVPSGQTVAFHRVLFRVLPVVDQISTSDSSSRLLG